MGHINEDSDSATSNIQNEYIIQEKQEKKHKCTYPNCHAMFFRPSRLQRHIRSHTGERPYKCNYPECTKSYNNFCHLKRHMDVHDSAKKVYVCSQCSKTISNLHNLKRHYKRMHNKDTQISCEECGKVFTKRQQLAQHQTIHSGLTIYKCDKCVKSFVNSSKLKQHQKLHEDKSKSYPCPISGCSEIFNKWKLLCAHRKAKHITEYKCDNCDKTFIKKSQLKIHSKIHTDNRIIFQCPYDKCHKAYLYNSNLEQHIKTSHLGKRFYCDICSIGLTAKQKLVEHIQRHHTLKRKKKSTKVERKKRNDAGIPKKSMISMLIGINLPGNLEKTVLRRETEISILET